MNHINLAYNHMDSLADSAAHARIATEIFSARPNLDELKAAINAVMVAEFYASRGIINR